MRACWSEDPAAAWCWSDKCRSAGDAVAEVEGRPALRQWRRSRSASVDWSGVKGRVASFGVAGLAVHAAEPGLPVIGCAGVTHINLGNVTGTQVSAHLLQQLHDGTVGRWLGRVTIDVSRTALVLPSPSPVVPIAVVVKEAIIHHAVVEAIIPTNHRRTTAIRASEPVIVSVAVDRYHCATRRNQRHTRTHTHTHAHAHTQPSTPVVRRQPHITPGARNSMASANMATNQLVAAPGPLHHFNRLAISKAAIALRTGVGRCYQRLIRLAAGAAKEVREEAAGLRHGEPGVSAGGGVVEGAAAHSVDT
ncbi:hypothetical protein OPT61_g8109 [Boeremia exigua]|uniref:Uncharacterized protein n=1 Tax=Boeremia exigua TaxID=749465 RepID=A0ACC2I044_9PLEO|nr:hypothetical protein OPT61_g8109 [Boeremia exigua]